MFTMRYCRGLLEAWGVSSGLVRLLGMGTTIDKEADQVREIMGCSF